MATSPTTAQLAEHAQSLEKRLRDALVYGGPRAEKTTALLQEYREACEALILGDYEYALTHAVETQLWDAHTRVNNAFRKELSPLKRNLSGHAVEHRRLFKHYLEFIKASQSFYRQYIRTLDAHAGGLDELRKIAQKLRRTTPATVPARARFPDHLQPRVIKSCHQTLIHLGDLSRYRESETLGRERNWGPAIGFYELDVELCPDSGIPHNQLAIIAREDGDHFRSTYHLYRALACKNPHPMAESNLALGFKKVVAAWAKGELINNYKSQDGNNAGHALVGWFVRLHSKCYKGEEFDEHDELENTVLTQLTVELKERSLDSILRKIILINLAAEYFATVQMQSDKQPANIMRTYCYYLRHNVKTFFTLLQILQSELERVSEGDDVTRTDDGATPLSDKITAVARRVLPGLRLYSTWFTRVWRILDAGIADTLTTVEVQELWKAYAATLTLLASSFPSSQLPEDNYMLEEDVETFGFQPLVAEETMVRWYHRNTLKTKYTDLERNHPNVEMLMRIRDLLFDGLSLTQIEEAPLVLDGLRFIYQEAGLPSELLASPNHRTNGSPPAIPEISNVPLFIQEAVQADDQQSYSARAPSETTSTNLARDSAMNQMVDDLVGADDGLDPLPEEDENIPPTPPEQTFEDTVVKDGQYGVGYVSNPVGSISIADLVKSVQNYRPTGSPAPKTPLLAVPMDRRGSSSSFRQPAALPSLPDGDVNGNSIWNPSYGGTPGPSSPFLNGHDARGSPNGFRNSYGHMRADSSASVRSNNEWGNGNAHPSPFARPAPGGIGNGAAWGNPAANMYAPTYANGYGQSGYAMNPTEINFASPLLFRGGSLNSELERAHSSHGRTPPNGQAG